MFRPNMSKRNVSFICLGVALIFLSYFGNTWKKDIALGSALIGVTMVLAIFEGKDCYENKNSVNS